MDSKKTPQRMPFRGSLVSPTHDGPKNPPRGGSALAGHATVIKSPPPRKPS